MPKESSSVVPILVIGGIGYYLYSSGFLSSLFGGSVAASTVASGVIPPPINTNPNPNATTTTPPIAPPITKQTPQTPQTPAYVAPCPPGQTQYNGVCVAQGSSFNANKGSVSQQMSVLAGTGLMTMDQWCYYFTQITGLACPRDPGDIIATAGPNPPSFPQGRDTPIDIGTWLAFMNQGVSNAISGLGELGCDCQPSLVNKMLGGLGQILDFGDFFTLQPHRKHLTGNFR